MIYLERKGLPTVSIASSGFQKDTVATAKAFGMETAPFVTIPCVITSVSPEESSREIEKQIDSIINGLTNPDSLRIDSSDEEAYRTDGPSITFQGKDKLDAWENFNKDFLDKGWGDGFPLIPPTEERVNLILSGTTLSPEHIVGHLPPGMGIATVKKIAISCAMAGCEPSHLPVIIAACKSIIQMGGRARQWLMSTSPDAPFMLINGPIVDELGINSKQATLGPGRQSRVNVILGRALRLTLMNVGHNYPGEMDMDTIGSAAKFSLCAAESQDNLPTIWPQFHTSKGFSQSSSTVTVGGVRNIIDAADLNNYEPEPLLRGVSGAITGRGGYASLRWSDPDPYDPEGGTGTIVILAPDHAEICAKEGWSKEMVRDFLWANTKVSAASLQNSFRTNPSFLLKPWRWILDLPNDQARTTEFPGFERPDKIELMSFGGPAGKSMVMFLNGPTQTVEISDRA